MLSCMGQGRGKSVPPVWTAVGHLKLQWLQCRRPLEPSDEGRTDTKRDQRVEPMLALCSDPWTASKDCSETKVALQITWHVVEG
eukprot:4284945-Amphidinium_carterae.1